MNKKNTDLPEKIKATQVQTAMPFADSNPSEVSDVFWIYALRQHGNYPAPTEQSGKWLVFVHHSEIDCVWAEIKCAIEEGKLGERAKVSTSLSNPNAADPENHVICVYTYDWADNEDMTRVREELRALGITQKIPYKSDEDTFAGKYKVNGQKGFRKRYE